MMKRHLHTRCKEGDHLLDEVVGVTGLVNGSRERRMWRRQRGHACGPVVDEALRLAKNAHDCDTLRLAVVVVAAMALVLADEGREERAVEVYATASRYPLVANRRLEEDWPAFRLRHPLRGPTYLGGKPALYRSHHG
jgi:hypothetical protein